MTISYSQKPLSQAVTPVSLVAPISPVSVPHIPVEELSTAPPPTLGSDVKDTFSSSDEKK